MTTTILVVDDATFMRITMKNVLTRAGFEVVEASDGVEALARYKQHNPNVVMMDITMPNKDSLEAVGEIRNFYPKAIILVCTAPGQERIVKRAVQAGAKDFIVKPFEPDRVVSAVKSALGQ